MSRDNFNIDGLIDAFYPDMGDEPRPEVPQQKVDITPELDAMFAGTEAPSQHNEQVVSDAEELELNALEEILTEGYNSLF